LEKVMKTFLKVVTFIFIVNFLLSFSFAQNQNYKLNVIFELISRENSYETYISKYVDKPRPKSVIIIPGVKYSSFSKDLNLKVLTDLTSDKHPVILTGENGYIEWTFNIKEEGLYNIAVKYFPIKGKNSSIERELLIDGKRPFNEARILRFERIWKDGGPALKDNRGNELRPIQVENPIWVEKILEDPDGLYADPFLFYFFTRKTYYKICISERTYGY